jgi:hypothetical protein
MTISNPNKSLGKGMPASRSTRVTGAAQTTYCLTASVGCPSCTYRSTNKLNASTFDGLNCIARVSAFNACEFQDDKSVDLTEHM